MERASGLENAAPERQEAISVLVVDDDPAFRSIISRRLKRRGYLVQEAESAEAALELAKGRHFDVAILDIALPGADGVQLLEQLRVVDPDTQAIMLTGHATVETAIRAMKLGAYDYLTKPCELAELELHVQRAYERLRLARENDALRTALKQSSPEVEIVGESPAIRRVLHMIKRVAPTDSPVLIIGESGTGKELVARAIHQASRRAHKPLVVINCAALQETLLESELFGHEKGAFTSAVASKPGLFELANGGTLFIDEIGEMAGSIQAKLLRVLEDGTFRRVGSVKEIKVNVRIVAATNKDLANEVAEKRFRDDLYYRLNVVTIHLPPLRERRSDIPLLVDYFLNRDPRGPRHIEPEALQKLIEYDWPGNVRELANVIERAKILCEQGVITVNDLPPDIVSGKSRISVRPIGERSPVAGNGAQNGGTLEDLERAHIIRVLQEHKWNKAKAARALGVSRRRLYRLLDKYGIKSP